jgi:putative transposase
MDCMNEQTVPAEDAAFPELTALSEQERQLALTRFRLLQPHLEQGMPLATLAQQENLCYRTTQRWVSLYRRFGLAALARRKRADRGGHRVLSQQIQQLIEGLALQKPPLPIAALYRQVVAYALSQNQKPPSYSLVYSLVQNLPPDLVMLAHDGSKAYGDTYELIHRREAGRPNAIWQADHCLLDIFLVREDGTTAKPWLTTIIDDYSRAIAGYFLSFDPPSTLRTALALRQAIWRKENPKWRICGIPEVFYTDNGSDFTSRHMEQVAADLKIRLVFSIPGKPRGRGRIERFFATLTQMCLCELSGYTPPGGATRDKPTLSLSELDKVLKTFLLEVYHHREHSQTKMPPQERWEAGGFLPQMPASLEQLDLLLLTVAKERKVQPDGIRFQGFRYVDPMLAAFVGESVILRYDPRDMAEVRLFHEGKFLCRAVCPELAGETLSLREVIRTRNQRRKELRTTIQERHKTVEALLERKRGLPESNLVGQGGLALQQGSLAQSEPSQQEQPAAPRPRLKRYLND